MHLVLNHEVNPVHSGYIATVEHPRLAARGLTPDGARRNLHKLAMSFFGSFERAGTLADEVSLAGLTAEDDEKALTIEIVAPSG